MTVYSELLAITTRAIKENWPEKNKEKQRRCEVIICLGTILNPPSAPTQRFALQYSLNILRIFLTEEIKKPETTLSREINQAILTELRDCTFPDSFIRKKQVLGTLYPTYFKEASVTHPSPEKTFKSSIWKLNDEISFKTRMINIAKKASEGLVAAQLRH